MTGFHEVRFPGNIAYGPTGGPEFDRGGGDGRRPREANVNWSEARGRWDIASGLKKQAPLDELKFGSTIAANLRRARPKLSDHRHLDQMAVFTEASSIGSGVQSTTRVRSWTWWSSEDETPRSPRSG